MGKIADIFAGCDIDTSAPTRSNAEGILETIRLLHEVPTTGLIFTNLVETDSMYGHRNDPEGFHRCLQEFDRELPRIRAALRADDLLILCSDHGCDPTTDVDRPLARARAAGGPHARRARRRARSGTTASSPTSAPPPGPG